MQRYNAPGFWRHHIHHAVACRAAENATPILHSNCIETRVNVVAWRVIRAAFSNNVCCIQFRVVGGFDEGRRLRAEVGNRAEIISGEIFGWCQKADEWMVGLAIHPRQDRGYQCCLITTEIRAAALITHLVENNWPGTQNACFC